MADYDPKRRRPRPPEPTDEPAAVDALLDAAAHAAAPQPDPDLTGEPAARSWDDASWADSDRPLASVVTPTGTSVDPSSPMVSGGVEADGGGSQRGGRRIVVLLVVAVAAVVVALVVRRRRQ
jgi:hypothetical protein